MADSCGKSAVNNQPRLSRRVQREGELRPWRAAQFQRHRLLRIIVGLPAFAAHLSGRARRPVGARRRIRCFCCRPIMTASAPGRPRAAGGHGFGMKKRVSPGTTGTTAFRTGRHLSACCAAKQHRIQPTPCIRNIDWTAAGAFANFVHESVFAHPASFSALRNFWI